MRLHLFKEHFSFIKCLDRFASSFCCLSCDKFFTAKWVLDRHQKTCKGSTREIYSNGIYTTPKTVFEELEKYGVQIPQNLRYCNTFAVFDCEVYMAENTGINNTDKVNFCFKHELASIAVASNVEGFTEPNCFVSDGDKTKLVEKTIKYLAKISEKAFLDQKHKFVDYIDEIEELDDEALVMRFERYLKQLIVLSFNGEFGVMIKFNFNYQDDNLISKIDRSLSRPVLLGCG